MLHVPAEYAWHWHTLPGALTRLLPPWEDIRIHSSTGGVEHGARVEMSVPIGWFHKRWVAEHRDAVVGQEFSDVQLQGPFAHWFHRHLFEPAGPDCCYLHDLIEYRLPAGAVGQALAGKQVEKKLATLFHFRHQRAKADLEAHYCYRERPRLKILVSGATGLVGSALIPFLTTGGHEVYRLVRQEAQALNHPYAIFWDIKQGEVDRQKLEGFDAVIHLSGAPIAGQRWNAAYREEIKNSRVKSTQLLSSLLATLHHKPEVLISFSGIGYYGSRDAEVLTEESSSGLGFLPEVTRAWEQAADPARKAGIRVVHPRLGVVLSEKGGALQKLKTPFQWGAGGVIGSGQQYWTAISLEDVIYAVHFCLMEKQLAGPVNFVMPEATTNRQFVKTLGQVFHRPTLFPLPAPIAKIVLGEMAQPLLLDSTLAAPQKLLEAGFAFQHPTLESALKFATGRFSPTEIRAETP